MNRVCLLGSTGFIGRSIASYFDQTGVDWIGISRSVVNGKSYSLELNGVERVIELISDCPIVVNASGSLKPADFATDFSNAMGRFWEDQRQLSDILESANVRRFIHISSAGTVYGEARGSGSREDDMLNPKSWYGRSKQIEEALLSETMRKTGGEFVCARVSNPFGNEDASYHGFLDVLINCIKNRNEFIAGFPKHALRDFIYAPAMAEMVANIALSDLSGVYNVASGKSIELEQLLSFVESNFDGVKIKREECICPTDVVSSVISIDKYLRHFGEVENNNISVYQYVKSELIDIAI